jgi:hypothetical protein
MLETLEPFCVVVGKHSRYQMILLLKRNVSEYENWPPFSLSYWAVSTRPWISPVVQIDAILVSGYSTANPT